jgi:hypothetical protein
MQKKVLKISLLVVGTIGLAYGAFKLTDILTGKVRLKYATFQIKKYEEPPISSEDIE